MCYSLNRNRMFFHTKVLKVTVLLLLGSLLGCSKTVIGRWETGEVKEIQFYKGKQLIWFKTYKLNGSLEREVYYNRKSNPDSARIYIEGMLNKKEYYLDGQISKAYFYWSNGNYRTVYDIVSVDTIIVTDSTGEQQEFIAYTGQQTNYYKNGKVFEKGPLVKSKRCGEWKFYETLGIDRIDTIRCE